MSSVLVNAPGNGDAAGKGDDGGHIGGDEGFLVAQCHQERAAHACDHHFFRFVLRHHGDGVRTVETLKTINSIRQKQAGLDDIWTPKPAVSLVFLSFGLGRQTAIDKKITADKRFFLSGSLSK